MSTASVSTPDERLLTAEEFAQLPDDQRTELIRGRVVEVPPPGSLHGLVQLEIASLLREYVRQAGIGRVVTESGVITSRAPDSVRGPDVSFFSFDRLPKGQVPSGYPAVMPEVVFEVLSPSQGFGGDLVKAGEYLAAGTLCVCVVDPLRRTAVLFRQNAEVVLLSENDTLRLPPPLDGWTPRIADFFPE
jgi:Uma2 family endonuclease